METWESEFKISRWSVRTAERKLIIGSPMDHIIAARRTCPVCKKEFMIENDKPVATKKLQHRSPG